MQQLEIYTPPKIFTCPNIGILQERLEESRDTMQKAISMANPYATGLMISGGDDSLTALKVALLLGVKLDFIMHGITGTGLKDVRVFVNQVAKDYNLKLIEADAGNAFEEYVNRKGFFGVGDNAHTFSYHILKTNPFDRAISKYIRRGKPNRNIILLNGVRIEESENRAKIYGDNPFKWQGKNLWVNLIHWFSKTECMQLLELENVKRSPVSIALGRSGECNCATMQNEASRLACSEYDPEWGLWMKNLRKHIIQKFGWDITQTPNKKILAEMNTVTQPLEDFMPMCVGCKAANKKLTLF